MSKTNDKPAIFYTIRQVAALSLVSRSTVDRWHRTDPSFPRKVLLASNSVRFLAEEIDSWLANRIRERGTDHG